MSTTITFPPAFLTAIRETLPPHLSLDDFTDACQRPLRRSVRVNTLKIGIAEFCALMDELGWQYTAIPWCPEGFWVDLPDDNLALGNLAEHLAGLFYIQEASSMMPPVALYGLSPEPVERVLDLAAAPGSKTTQIGAYQAGQGVIIANEYAASRVKVLHANCKRMGLHNLAISHFDGRVHGEYLPECFDAVLIDAPCSGEGTIRKDPDALKNWTPEAIDSISQTQRELLQSAFLALKPGGSLVYSTCALNGRENQAVCDFLLESYPGLVEVSPLNDLFDGAEQCATREGFLHVWPQIYDSEGFFVARFTKTGSVNSDPTSTAKRKFPFVPLGRKPAAELKAQLSIQLGQPLQDARLYQRDKEIWLFPAAIEPILDNMRFQRIGIKVAEQYAKGYNLQHEAVVTLARDGLSLTREQACQFYRGQDIGMENPGRAKGEVVVSYQGRPIGLCKWVGNKLKNKLPRDLVRDNPL